MFLFDQQRFCELKELEQFQILLYCQGRYYETGIMSVNGHCYSFKNISIPFNENEGKSNLTQIRLLFLSC